MQWKTSISHITEQKEIIRGYELNELIHTKTFVETIYLILKGTLPDENQTRMLNALFTACIDHGIGVASTMSARLVASAGNSLHTALASGILAFGDLHGGAIEGAAKFFQNHVKESDVSALVKRLKEQKIRIPGYGHKVFTEEDPRTKALFEIAKTTKTFGKHCEFAQKLGEELNKISSKKLPLNIDGGMAAILSDMNFDWRMAKGFFIIGRVPGLVAHIYEELIQGDGLRRLKESETEYTGK